MIFLPWASMLFNEEKITFLSYTDEVGNQTVLFVVVEVGLVGGRFFRFIDIKLHCSFYSQFACDAFIAVHFLKEGP